MTHTRHRLLLGLALLALVCALLVVGYQQDLCAGCGREESEHV